MCIIIESTARLGRLWLVVFTLVMCFSIVILSTSEYDFLVITIGSIISLTIIGDAIALYQHEKSEKEKKITYESLYLKLKEMVVFQNKAIVDKLHETSQFIIDGNTASIMEKHSAVIRKSYFLLWKV